MIRRGVPRAVTRGCGLNIHPTAIVDRRADIDRTAEIGPYCVIDAHVHVGPGCRLMHGVYLTGWTHLEPNCILHPGVVVGHEPQDVKYKGERSFCRVGEGTILREYVTIHRGTDPESTTTIGRNCFLLAASHVAHNCTLGDHVTLINAVLLAGHVKVSDRTTIGGGAGIHQFVRIGELSMIAGTARVTMDVPPFALIDAAGRVAGLNRVGIRRAGYTTAESNAVREAYRTLYRPGLGFRNAVAELAAAAEQSPAPVQRLVEFLTTPSRRGFAGRARGSASAAPSAE